MQCKCKYDSELEYGIAMSKIRGAISLAMQATNKGSGSPFDIVVLQDDAMTGDRKDMYVSRIRDKGVAFVVKTLPQDLAIELSLNWSGRPEGELDNKRLDVILKAWRNQIERLPLTAGNGN